MKRFAFSVGLMAALPLAAMAQGFGGEFMSNWDTNEDGQVTRAEVLERRGDLFYMFDSDEDGRLNDEEYATFDETRAMDREMHMEEYGIVPGQGVGNGQGNGQGKAMGNGAGQGQGKMRQETLQSGKGMGPGPNMAAGIDAVQNSMTRRFNDVNGDGVVTREEFVGNGEQWFTRMDRNSDGIINLADFGA